MQHFNTHSLQTRQTNVVNAQLQQAIQLLHMGNSELTAFIEQQAETNPFLEVSLPRMQQTTGLMTTPRSTAASDEDWDRLANVAGPMGGSLYAHVSDAVEAMHLSTADRSLAEHFMDALEPSGWLGLSPEAIAAMARVPVERALALLERLQKIEPAGLFARNLAECLRLQVIERGLMTAAYDAVLNNLPMLAAADLKGLARVAKCSQEELRDILRSLRSLNPKPGAEFDTGTDPQRAPDLIVSQTAQGWQVDLNRSTLPSVVISTGSAREIVSRHRPESAYVSERLSVARWLARAVEHRNQTTLKVGAEILRRQAGFLDKGPSHLQPMVLRDVAEAIGVHESTVSRVTTGMLMQTPHGTFPLKWFFSVALSRTDGEEAGSAAAVRHRIRQLVQAEDPSEPLSDDAIAKIISDEGIQLARRTVAKYREQQNIPSSTQRRRKALLNGRA